MCCSEYNWFKTSKTVGIWYVCRMTSRISTGRRPRHCTLSQSTLPFASRELLWPAPSQSSPVVVCFAASGLHGLSFSPVYRLLWSCTLESNIVEDTFLSDKIWWFGIQLKKTTTQFQVHVYGQPVHTFQLRILNWKTGNWKVWQNSVFHAPFSVFQFSSFGFAALPVFQTGKV